MRAVLARWRVALGFVAAAAAFVLAQPSWGSWRTGVLVAVCGELLRIWAAGHIEKSREITSSGPYRWMRHPLYTGSALLGVGFVIASRSVPVAVLATAYLALTLLAAVRSEEAHLDEKFDGAYSAWRKGQLKPTPRAFSLARAFRNREHHTVAGAVIAFLWLAYRVP